MSNKDEILKISIKDWVEKLYELLRNEDICFDSEEAIIETLIVKYQLTSQQAGEILTAAKHKGLLPEGVKWPEPKVNLSVGSGQLVRLMLKSDLVSKKLPNGRDIKVRKYLGERQDIEETESEFESELSQPIDLLEDNNHLKNVTHDLNVKNGNGNGFVTPRAIYISTQSERGIENAKYYLLNTVIGNIRARMAELAGLTDLRLVAEELKKSIDDIVNELC